MNLPISIQVMKQTRIENERYYSKRDKAKKMFQPLQEKCFLSLEKIDFPPVIFIGKMCFSPFFIVLIVIP